MWRSKKFIVGAVLAAVMLLGIIGGVVLAANNSEDSEADTKYEALLDRVCEIYEENTGVAINSEALQGAFADARTQMAEDRAEMRAAAMETHPEMGPEAMQNHLDKLIEEGVITEGQATALKEWLDARPENVPFGPGFRGMVGPCAPIATE